MASPAAAPVWQRHIELPRYLRAVEGRTALVAELARVAAELGFERLCVVTGPTASAAIGAPVAAELAAGGEVPALVVTDWSRSAVRTLGEQPGFAAAGACVAIGGGKVLDVAKRACEESGKPAISVPTLLSTDGIASPVAVIRCGDGSVESLPARLPIAVVVDLEVIAGAPVATARAGFGDLVANLTAVRDWRLAEAAGKATVDDFAALLAQASAELAMTRGLGALGAGRPGPDLLRRLLEGLVLSGLAMEIAGSSRPCSGAEHLISHALDRLHPGLAAHGEQVAFGTLLAARLQGEGWRALRATLVDAGLERAAHGFGLAPGEVVAAVQAAPQTRPGRYTVLDEVGLSAGALEPVVEEVLAG